jgi:uncharacterized DUF497 family protein
MFEWDENKGASNRRVHRISFEEAIAVWLDPGCVTVPSIRSEDGEDRFKTIGLIEGRLFVVVWTPRDGSIRVISARRCNDPEEDAYYGQDHPPDA